MRLASRLKSHRPAQNPVPRAFQDSALSADVTVSNYLSASPTRLVRRAEITQVPPYDYSDWKAIEIWSGLSSSMRLTEWEILKLKRREFHVGCH